MNRERINILITRIKEHPLTIIITSLTATFAFIVTLYTQFDTIKQWYLSEYTSFKEYEQLEKMNVTLTKNTVVKIFGDSLTKKYINKNISNKLVEETYVLPKFYLQVIYDKNDEVIFYAVTSRDSSFHPPLPCSPLQEKAKLGEQVFDDINPNMEDASVVYAYFTSKHYNYAESYYFGNPCKYHTYYLGYNTMSGIDYNLPNISDISNYPTTTNPYELYGEISNKDNLKNRKIIKPNIYGVLKSGMNLNDFLDIPWDTEIGVHFMTIDNLPAK